MKLAEKKLTSLWRVYIATFKGRSKVRDIGSPLLYRAALSFVGATSLTLLAASPVKAAVQAEQNQDLTQYSLEQLINISVYTASKFEQKASDAPSAVTVITSADIKAYGYRKLSDILRSIRGIYGRYDRDYDFIGLRGFGRPGDYQSRFLLLLDGYRLNDANYDASAIGTDFIVDIDLIDRVEFVPGPGSSIYGSNAFFGVVNVITRTAKDVKGLEVSTEVASYDTTKTRLTYGGRFENGLTALVSGSIYDSGGRDIYFQELDSPATNNGVARNLDYDHYGSFFTKLSYSDFTLTAAYSKRQKGVPTASYNTPFNDPNSNTVDKQTFVNLQYYKNYSEKLNVTGSVFYGEYPYNGNYPLFDNANNAIIDHEVSRPKWWGGEIKFVNTQFNSHKLVYGAEYRNNYQQHLSNFVEDPSDGYVGRNSSKRYGVYLQDEYELSKQWIVNVGARYDIYGGADNAVSPRLGVIYKPEPSSAVKLLYGTAFRAPNVYELYYESVDHKSNHDLKPEKIKTYDLVFERYYDNRLRVMAGLFYYKTYGLIDSYIDPADGLDVYANIEAVDTRGAEFEVEHRWRNGAKIRTSLTLQKTRDVATNTELTNSPKVLMKFNGSTPLFDTKMQGGLEVQYTAKRDTTNGGTAGGYAVANLTLLSGQWIKNLYVSATIYNLFDRRYYDPSGLEYSNSTPGVVPGLDTIYQDGRNYRMKATYKF